MNKIILLFLTVSISGIFLSCKKDTPPLPDILVNFETSQQGFDGAETLVKLSLSRAADVATTLTVSLVPSRVTYGTEFVTEPSASSGLITLSVPAGSTSATFKVLKPSGTVFLNGDESIQFKLTSVGAPAFSGATTELKLSFSAITSTGSQLTLEGKTTASAYANVSYADLSANRQTASDRKLWNLAFSSGSQFRVILNQAYQGSAIATSKTDISAVTLADADAVANINFAPGEGSLDMVDQWDGEDLSKTAFAEVSATHASNKVYLVSFEGSKEKDKWFKVKVNRKGEGYSVSYARIGETTIKTIDIAKNDDYNFTFLSLETNQVVSAEPRKNSWDIQWSYGTYNSGLNTPYWFQDFVLINNIGGTQAAEVLETSVTYANYSIANVAGTVFSKKRDAIGSKWRVTSGASLGIRRDRFYVIKDAAGNVYKLKFVSMGLGGDGGERGRPVIEYALVR